MNFVDILIYILASTGLVFTIVSIVQMYSYRNSDKFNIDNLNEQGNIKIIIKITNLEKEKIDDILEKIKTGNYDNIYEIADEVKINRYN